MKYILCLLIAILFTTNSAFANARSRLIPPEAPLLGDTNFPLPNVFDNERFYFAGDSITDQAIHFEGAGWGTIFQQNVTNQRRNVTVFWGGIGGNTSRDLAGRINSGLATSQPSTVVIWIGANDVFSLWPILYTAHYMGIICSACESMPTVRQIVLVSPYAYTENWRNIPNYAALFPNMVTFNSGLNNVHNYLYEVVKQKRARGDKRYFFVPMRQWFLDFFEPNANPASLPYGELVTPASLPVHPNQPGHIDIGVTFTKIFQLQSPQNWSWSR